MRRAVPFLVFVLGGIIFTGSSCEDGDPCAGVGCFNRFAFYLRPSASDATARFTPGTYRLDAMVDGEVFGCNFALPADRTAHYECSGREILAGTDLVFVTFPGKPETIEVMISMGTDAIFSDTYVPTYEASTPNGPNCPSTCEAASADAFVEP